MVDGIKYAFECTSLAVSFFSPPIHLPGSAQACALEHARYSQRERRAHATRATKSQMQQQKTGACYHSLHQIIAVSPFVKLLIFFQIMDPMKSQSYGAWAAAYEAWAAANTPRATLLLNPARAIVEIAQSGFAAWGQIALLVKVERMWCIHALPCKRCLGKSTSY